MKNTAWNKGIDHLSNDAKKRIGLASRLRIKEKGHPKGMLGKHHSKETILKIKSWKPNEEQKKLMTHHGEDHGRWKGRVKTQCFVCKKSMLCRTNRVRKYCSYECLGKSKRKMMECIDCQKPFKVSKLKRCRKCHAKWNVGPNNPSWKGGTTPLLKSIRHSARYKEWRMSVFERDNWTCQECGVRGGKIQADHIKSFALYPELRFDLENGRTLCIECHKKTSNYGFRKSNVKK